MGRRIFFSFNGSRVNRSIHQKKDHFMIWDWEFVIESIKNKIGSRTLSLFEIDKSFFTVFSSRLVEAENSNFVNCPQGNWLKIFPVNQGAHCSTATLGSNQELFQSLCFLCILLCPVQCTLSLWVLRHCLPLQNSSGSNFQFSLRQTKNSICFHLFQIHYKTMSGFWWCWLIKMKF